MHLWNCANNANE